MLEAKTRSAAVAAKKSIITVIRENLNLLIVGVVLCDAIARSNYGSFDHIEFDRTYALQLGNSFRSY